MAYKRPGNKRFHVGPADTTRRKSTAITQSPDLVHDDDGNVKATPALSESKSLASSPSLPTTPLSTSTTMPSSPEVELAKRSKASPANNRAFHIALRGAFRSNEKVTPERQKHNHLAVEIQEEETENLEPLIDLSDSWERNTVKDLDHFVVTVKPVAKAGTEIPSADKKPTSANTALSPWSKPFNPRREDGHVSHRSLGQALPVHRRYDSQDYTTVHRPASQVSQSIFKFPPPIRAPYSIPQVHGNQLSSRPAPPSAVLPVQPPVTTSHPIASPSPSDIPLFAPRAQKVVSIRPPTSSPPVQSPETPSKVKAGSATNSLVKARIALPYEDDYDSDEDPFYPVASRSYRERADSDGLTGVTGERVVRGLELQLESDERQSGDPDDDSPGLDVAERISPMRSPSPKPASPTPSSLMSSPEQLQDVFGGSGPMRANVKAPVFVPRQNSGSDCVDLTTATLGNSPMASGNSPTPSARSQIHNRGHTVPAQNSGPTAQVTGVELKAQAPSRSYNFTFCRAHLGELSCPYGKYCCFKHPRLREPISSEQLAQIERELSRKEQEKVNFGKIRGLMTTRSIAITPEDGTALIVLYAEAVLENATRDSVIPANSSGQAMSPSPSRAMLPGVPGAATLFAMPDGIPEEPMGAMEEERKSGLDLRWLSQGKSLRPRHSPPVQEDID
ncbi:hypothetical protein HD553DRAFT_342736 [Filobasidium floriforme]|uniref:uncharacterized protein n=1 Tax=Filobasidium floriforme TaxID=5210 RepID=UPI001E8D8E31|nr:uncharacterized protein HD553DRAFT_342736 [Filobasidium floriforme]KAH8083512.1 hypothetical protein HD553DRAFT_342736 [Filobasidium floriforme]